MVRREGRWGKLCMDNIDDLFAQHDSINSDYSTSYVKGNEDEDDAIEQIEPWTINNLGESVCKTLSYR